MLQIGGLFISAVYAVFVRFGTGGKFLAELFLLRSHVCELLVLLFCVLLSLLEELLGSLRECTGKAVVTNLAHDEVTVRSRRLLAVELERVLTVVSTARVKRKVCQ